MEINKFQITTMCQEMARPYIKEGGLCIDATMGNGHDTLFLRNAAGDTGKVLAFDIQQQAFANTEELFVNEGVSISNVEMHLISHEEMDQFTDNDTVDCIMFNLGYLPSGDHSCATTAEGTCNAIKRALPLLRKGGMMSLCIYSGGDTGFEEKESVLALLKNLNTKKYLVLTTEYYNRPNNPPMIAQIIRMK